MDSELWSRVKVGDYFLFANQYEGVFKARVIEVDLRIYEESAGPGFPSRWTNPYGLTATTGVVKVRMNSEDRILNLGELIPYKNWMESRLESAWTEYQAKYADMEAYRDIYTALITKYLSE